MTDDNELPSAQEQIPPFAWGTPEARDFLEAMTRRQIETGLAQSWDRNMRSFLQKRFAPQGDEAKPEILSLGTEYPILATFDTPPSENSGNEHDVEWYLIKINPLTGLGVPGSLVDFAAYSNGVAMTGEGEPTPELIAALEEQIALQRQAGIPDYTPEL